MICAVSIGVPPGTGEESAAGRWRTRGSAPVVVAAGTAGTVVLPAVTDGVMSGNRPPALPGLSVPAVPVAAIVGRGPSGGVVTGCGVVACADGEELGVRLGVGLGVGLGFGLGFGVWVAGGAVTTTFADAAGTVVVPALAVAANVTDDAVLAPGTVTVACSWY
jgi:hypothetical protein